MSGANIINPVIFGGGTKIELLLSSGSGQRVESVTLSKDYAYIIADVTIPIVRSGYNLTISITNGRTAVADKTSNAGWSDRELHHRTIAWRNCKSGDVVKIGTSAGACSTYDVYGII